MGLDWNLCLRQVFYRESPEVSFTIPSLYLNSAAKTTEKASHQLH